jgi:serine/threonine-protein kinase
MDHSLAYLPGTGGWPKHKLVLLDRLGQALTLPLPPHTYYVPRLSPDGQYLASSITSQQKGEEDIWISELERNTLTRLTFNPYVDHTPIWTPDAKRVTFSSGGRFQPPDLSCKPADGTGADERLSVMDHAQFPTCWSPDGRNLLFTDEHPDTKFDIWILSMNHERKSQPLIRSQFNETAGVFSPDARWIAYQSDESSRYEIYVRPFPELGSKKQISVEGGTEPVWAPGGRELFYRNGAKMMVVAIKTYPQLKFTKPKLLFEGVYATNRITANYDITHDGTRFLMIKEEKAVLTQINVVLNWAEELKRLVKRGI